MDKNYIANAANGLRFWKRWVVGTLCVAAVSGSIVLLSPGGHVVAMVVFVIALATAVFFAAIAVMGVGVNFILAAYYIGCREAWKWLKEELKK